MTTIQARQIQLTKMRIRKTNKVLYIVSNIYNSSSINTQKRKRIRNITKERKRRNVIGKKIR